MAEELKKVEIDGLLYAINGDKTVVLASEKNTSADHLKNVTIPSEVTIEGKKYNVTIEDMFYCENIIISPGIKSIGRMYMCKRISIPSTVTAMDTQYYSYSILYCCHDIRIPSSVTRLTGGISCSKEIEIPSSIKHIDFISGQDGKLYLRMRSAIPPKLDKATYLGNGDMLEVPQGAAEAYKNDKMWGKFKKIVEDPTLNEGADEAAAAVAKAPDLISRIEDLEKRIAALEAKLK